MDKKVKQKPLEWFLKLPQYLKKLTKQVAMGGGEPLTEPEFIAEFGKECKKHGLIFNITSNGLAVEKVPAKTFKNITMVSLSFDAHKATNFPLDAYGSAVEKLKSYGVKVGSNTLISSGLLYMGLSNVATVFLKNIKVDRLFVLCPKNFKAPDILAFAGDYVQCAKKYKGKFFVDDVTSRILEEGAYTNWKKPCHYGKGLVSIGPDGGVSGCSFAEPEYKLNKPEEVLQGFTFTEKKACPFLIGGHDEIKS